MKPDGSAVGVRRHLLFWSIALGGAAFDLVTKSIVFSELGPPEVRHIHSVVPHILDLRTSHNTGALWGFGATIPYSSLIFAGLSVDCRGGDPLLPVRRGSGLAPDPHRSPWA